MSPAEESPGSPFDDLAWWTKAWIWLRKWGWVPVGFILLVLGFIAGGAIFRRRSGGGVADPLYDIKQAIERNNAEIDEEVRQSAAKRDEEIRRIEEEHAEKIAALTEDQEQRRQEYRRNPKKMAKWLTQLAKGEDG